MSHDSWTLWTLVSKRKAKLRALAAEIELSIEERVHVMTMLSAMDYGQSVIRKTSVPGARHRSSSVSGLKHRIPQSALRAKFKV